MGVLSEHTLKVSGNFSGCISGIIEFYEHIDAARDHQKKIYQAKPGYPRVDKGIVDDHNHPVYEGLDVSHPDEFSAYNEAVNIIQRLRLDYANADLNQIESDIHNIEGDISSFVSFVESASNGISSLSGINGIGSTNGADNNFAINFQSEKGLKFAYYDKDGNLKWATMEEIMATEGAMLVTISGKVSVAYMGVKTGDTGADQAEDYYSIYGGSTEDTKSDNDDTEVEYKDNDANNSSTDNKDERGLTSILGGVGFAAATFAGNTLGDEDGALAESSDTDFNGFNEGDVARKSFTNDDEDEENKNKSSGDEDGKKSKKGQEGDSTDESGSDGDETKDYDELALEQYNNLSDELKTASILAAVSQANVFFDGDKGVLTNKLMTMGYSQNDAANIASNRDATIEAFTKYNKNQELARISNELAERDGVKNHVSRFGKVEGMDTKGLNDINGNPEESSLPMEEEIQNKIDELIKENGEDKSQWSAENLQELETLENQLESVSSLGMDEVNIINSDEVTNNIEPFKEPDSNGIQTPKLDLNITETIKPKDSDIINHVVGLVNGVPTELLTVLPLVASKGISKLISGKKNQKVIVNYDELALYKYHKLDSSKIIMDEKEVLKETEELFKVNKDLLGEKLKKYGYSDIDVSKMCNNEELAMTAMLDGLRREKLAEIAVNLAKEDGIEDYQSKYINNDGIVGLENGLADSLNINFNVDEEFDKVSSDYFKIEREFADYTNSLNDQLRELNNKKSLFDEFIKEHGDDTGAWSTEEYNTYQQLNKEHIDANNRISESNSHLSELETIFSSMRQKYELEKNKKVKKIDPRNIKELIAD